MTARPPSQRIDQAKRLLRLNAPPQPKKVAAPIQVTQDATLPHNPWARELGSKLRDRAIALGEDFKEFFAEKDHVFWQPGRRRPYFDQVDPDHIKLAWPFHGCGVFNMEGGTKGLGIVRMIRFDIKLQKSTLLVEWVYTVKEVRAEITKAKPLNATNLRSKLNKMNSNRDLLLSNHMAIVPNGSFLGPAIEPPDEVYWQRITHWLDYQEWRIFQIETRDLIDLVRPVKYDQKTQEFGDLMDVNEFYSNYGHHATPKGLLTDDIHPLVKNPLCILENFLQDGPELQTLALKLAKAEQVMHEKEQAEKHLEEAQNRRAEIMKALGIEPALAPEPDFSNGDETDSEEMEDGEEEEDQDQLDEDEEQDEEGEGEDQDVDMSSNDLESEDYY